MAIISPQAVDHRPPCAIYRSVREYEVGTSASRADLSLAPLEICNSQFWSNKGQFLDASERLWQTRNLKPGWDTYGADPPNESARELAYEVLALLQAGDIAPARLLPSVEGGISISFVRGNARAAIEIFNTGEIVAATYSKDDEPVVWELDKSEGSIRDSIGTIREHLIS